jgi:hypothetical protein
MALIGKENGASGILSTVDGEGRSHQLAKRTGWVFKAMNQVHTWPLGYMNWVVGYKKSD